MMLLASAAVAQAASLEELLVGTWVVTTVDDVRTDGSRFQAFGPDPRRDRRASRLVTEGQSGEAHAANPSRIASIAV
jgi:hypothetical protein